MRLNFLFLVLFLTCGCTKKITRPSSGITFHNGDLLYQGKLFSGIVVENFEHVGTRRETEYKAGLPHGIQNEYFTHNQKLASRREYRFGRNSGTHEGWFVGGERRFHYEYNNQGESEGDFWEWYSTGHPSLFARFKSGQLLGKKMWREDGKIYMNYVFANGQAVGTPGTKLCYQERSPTPKNLKQN